jgi:hypothetical protein
MGKQPTILFHLLYSNLFYVEAFLAHWQPLEDCPYSAASVCFD